MDRIGREKDGEDREPNCIYDCSGCGHYLRPAYFDISSYGMVYIFNNSDNVSCNNRDAHIGDE